MSPRSSSSRRFPSTLSGSFLIAAVVLAGPSSGQCDFTLEQKLEPPPGGQNLFGTDVALEGDVLAVGVPLDDTGTSNGGAVHVYRHDGSGTWNFEQLLYPLDSSANDEFGRVLDIDGEWMVVGAHLDDDPINAVGAAYVFHYQGGQWVEFEKLLASDAEFNDRFGSAVAIDGDTIVVGAPQEDDPAGGSSHGAAYVFRYDGSSHWAEEQKLTADVRVANGIYGAAVDTAAGWVVVGHSRDGANGSAEAYEWNGSSWIRQQVIKGSTTLDDGSRFGSSLVLDGDRLVVGDPFGEGGRVSGVDGEAFLFERDGSTWSQSARVFTDFPLGLPNIADTWGTAVAIAGGRMAAGAPGPSFGYLTTVLKRGVLWGEEMPHIQPGDLSGLTELGSNLAFDGAVIVAGAPGQANNVGAVYVYRATTPVMTDCNANGIDDACDLSLGVSRDCDGSGVPDECEGLPDCDGDGVPDACGFDCNSNGVPDECEASDCDADGVPDDCEDDCDNDGVPDDCDSLGEAVFEYDGEVAAPDPSTLHFYGDSVSLRAGVLAIGCSRDDVHGGEAGTVYVYRSVAGGFTFEQALRADDGAANDYLGEAVDVDAGGERIVAGAPYYERGALNAQGAAYVFRLQGYQWVQEALLLPDDAESYAYFGDAVAIDGDTIVVGAYGQDGPSTNSEWGAAYVFRFDGTAWSQEAKLVPDVRLDGGDYGTSVDVLGNRVIVGHPGDADGGSVEVFTWDGASWSREQVLEGMTTTGNDRFGAAVALDAVRAAIGAPLGNGGPGPDFGEVFVFDHDGSTWSETQRLFAAAPVSGDLFGTTVVLAGGRLVAGAPQSSVQPGYALSFVLQGSVWVEQPGLLRPPGAAGNDKFARALTLFGTTLVAGAPFDDVGSSPDDDGSVHVFGLVGCDGPPDCNQNGVDDADDISGGTSQDCNGNGVPDECEPDCDGDGVPDGCEADCNGNRVPDECESFTDCDSNGVPDECDPDCDGDGLPDACENDCNANGTPDDCEGFADCNSNGIPDECEADCDLDGVPDDCEVDCDADGVPDDCEPDCDADGVPDDCELDCNANGTPDDCEAFADCNSNGVPDECEPDCDGDGTPDGCEPDCDGDSTPDDCEPDCDGDGTPDDCEPDCDLDGTPDDCESDCDGDGTPDDCEPDCDMDGVPDDCEADCDLDGVPDDCEPDCDADGLPDGCEPDCDGDGTPDDCEMDTDVDGTPDECDVCPTASDPGQVDSDGDGIGNACDNCVFVFNPGQEDADGDGLGDACARWYVDQDATGASHGRSWRDAFTDLQDALASALPSDEIWVAEGVYLPSSAADRSASFVLRDGVSVYGGFAGVETLLSERDPAANPTVLSGDLLGDDGASFANTGDNSYHVVVGSGTNLTARLDGFVVQGGSATHSGGRFGGGLLILGGSPSIVGCTFLANHAIEGGAVYVSSGAPILRQCVFEGNDASRGAAVRSGGSVLLTGCTLRANQAGQGGGVYSTGDTTLVDCMVLENTGTHGLGVTSWAGSLRVVDSTFLDNSGSSRGRGAAIDARNSTVDVTGSVFERNNGYYGGAVLLEYAEGRLSRCTFRENSSRAGGALYAYRSPSRLEACSFVSNEGTSRSSGGALRIAYDDVSLESCSFFGNRAYEGGAVQYYAGAHSFVNCSFGLNRSQRDGGGISGRYGSLDVVGSILWNNYRGSTPSQVYAPGASLSVSYSQVEGGWSGTGNSAADPMLVSLATGDLRLLPGSPCIDSADGSALPAGALFDLDGNLRAHDDPATPNSGVGSPPFVDRGAFEHGGPAACEGDCDGDGVCDADEIAAGEADVNGNGVPDACEASDGASGVAPGQGVTLLPGGSADRTQDAVVEFTNVSGAITGTVTVVQSAEDLNPGAGGFAAFGQTLTIETNLPDGAFELRVSIPFDLADLGGALPLASDLLYHEPVTFDWTLAAAGNTQPSPGHPGPLGDRFPVEDTVVPTLSDDLGDHGVFWDPTLERGFVWAKVDHATDFGGGHPFDVLIDCNLNGVPDADDIEAGTSADCNANGVPDACELAAGLEQDCDQNGIPDFCDLDTGTATDCNGNLVPDACDIAAGTSQDVFPPGGDGLPDECQLTGVPGKRPRQPVPTPGDPK